MPTYNSKYKLDDFFNNNSILPQFELEQKEQIKGKEARQFKKRISRDKGTFNINDNEIIGLLSQIAFNGAISDYTNMITNVDSSQIVINGKLKRNRTLINVVDDVYNNINVSKGMLSQIISNYSMLKDAIEYSHTLKSKPHLYLTLNSKYDLKNLQFFGNKTAGKTKFMTEIMMNLYFNDAFKPIQDKYGIRNEKVIRDRNLIRNYEYEKDRWERRVGKK